MKRLRWLYRAPLLLVPIFWWSFVLPIIWRGYAWDTPVYRVTADRVAEGGTPYDPLPPEGPHRITGPYYLYPPPFAALLSLTPGDWLQLHRVVGVLNVASVFVLGAALALAGGWTLPWAGLLWAGVLAFVLAWGTWKRERTPAVRRAGLIALGVTVAVLLAWLVLLYADPPWDLRKGR